MIILLNGKNANKDGLVGEYRFERLYRRQLCTSRKSKGPLCSALNQKLQGTSQSVLNCAYLKQMHRQSLLKFLFRIVPHFVKVQVALTLYVLSFEQVLQSSRQYAVA